MALKMTTEVKEDTVFDPHIVENKLDSTLGVELRVKTEMLKGTAFDYFAGCKSPFKGDPDRIREITRNLKNETLVKTEILNNIKAEYRSADDVDVSVSSKPEYQDKTAQDLRALLSGREVLNMWKKRLNTLMLTHAGKSRSYRCYTMECVVQEDDTKFEHFLGLESSLENKPDSTLDVALKVKTEVLEDMVPDPFISCESSLGSKPKSTLEMKPEMLEDATIDHLKPQFNSDLDSIVEATRNVENETLMNSEVLIDTEECKSANNVAIPVSSRPECNREELAQDSDKDSAQTLLTCRTIVNKSRKGKTFHACDERVFQCEKIGNTMECEMQENDTKLEHFLGLESPLGNKLDSTLQTKSEMLKDAVFDHLEPQFNSDLDSTVEVARNVKNETSMNSGILDDTEAEYRSANDVEPGYPDNTARDLRSLLSSRQVLSTWKKRLNTLMSTHAGKSRSYRCKSCDKRFKWKDNLSRHVRYVHDDKCESCPHCTKRYRRHDQLLQHVRIKHKRDDRYCCDNCGRWFVFKANLARHLTSCRKPERPYYRCKFCTNRYVWISQLHRHLGTHAANYPFSCAHCDKHFNEKREVIFHVRTHVKNIPYFCNHCEKKFSKNADLKRHKWAVHFGKDLYRCYHCNKQFLQKAKLARHMPIHSIKKIAKPYVCTVCKKGYAWEYSVKVHMRTCYGDS